jgi:AcrR family transcriptional regulator
VYKLCKTEQSAARQRELEQGLLKYMLSHRYEEISVSSLCDQLEIPRKSFYRYFSSKDGALHALLDHTLMEYEGFNFVYRGGEKRTLQRELEQFFQFWIVHKTLLDALQRSDMSGILIERAIFHALSDAVMPKRFLPNDTEEIRRQITMFGVCGLMSMVLTWHHDGYPDSARDKSLIAERLLAKPLFPDADNLI